MTTLFDAVGAVCTAVAAALLVLGLPRPAGAAAAAGVVLLAWSWLWVGAPGAAVVAGWVSSFVRVRVLRRPAAEEGPA